MYPEGVAEVDIQCVKLMPGMEAKGQTVFCVAFSIICFRKQKRCLNILQILCPILMFKENHR